jgi:Transposase DDE domain
MDILHLFCEIDDFCQFFEPQWKKFQFASLERKRNRESSLTVSEIMTLIVLFHASAYRNFKSYYTEHVLKHLAGEFPHLVSYNRFVELMSSVMIPLCCYLETRKRQCSGISFIDSTSLKVCHNRRIYSHKVFETSARRGKTSVDWFYGFKLHLVVNDQGELLSLRLTAGNVDDRQPVERLIKELFERLFFNDERHLQLITKLKKGMKNRLMPLFDKIILRKRSIIESVIDQLKNISQIEHTRHRSAVNFFVNLIAGLIAYTWREKKPSLNIHFKDQVLLPEVAF